MEDELKKYAVVNDAGIERTVSRKVAAWILLLKQLCAASVIGLLLGSGAAPEGGPLAPSWAIATGIVWALIWVPFGRHWFFFYYKGILASGKRDRLIAPCFKHDSLWDKFRNVFWPRRHSVPLSDVERLYISKNRESRKGSDGKKISWTIYELNVTGGFGALTMRFRERNKRDETRNVIREVMKSSRLAVKESSDNFF